MEREQKQPVNKARLFVSHPLKNRYDIRTFSCNAARSQEKHAAPQTSTVTRLFEHDFATIWYMLI
jgi:hypothetical protein